jgi:hypothetical protein
MVIDGEGKQHCSPSLCFYIQTVCSYVHTYPHKVRTHAYTYPILTVTHIPTATQRFGKQARNKYATYNRADPWLGNASDTRTQRQNRCCKRRFLCWSVPCPLLSNDSVNTFQRIRNNRERPLLSNGRVFCAVVRPEAT